MFGPKPKKAESMAASAPLAQMNLKSAPPIEEESNKGEQSNMPNVIGKGTVIDGNIIAEGDLVVEGIVRGDVTTKTSLIVGQSCTIEGNILAQHAVVAGRVKGTVQALGLLVIKSSSIIDGDVLTKNLNVESGSTFNGRFTVGSVTSTEPKAVKRPEAAVTEHSEVRRSASAAAPSLAKV